MEEEENQTQFARWTRKPQRGALLPLIAAGMTAIRLALEAPKRRDQVAELFKTAPQDVRDAAVSAVESQEQSEMSDILARFTISNERIDSYDSTIKYDGWETQDFRNNPIVLFAHNSWSLPVGRDIGVYADHDKRALMGTTRFVGEKMGAEEAKVGKWVAAGVLNATSVGFEPLEWEVAEDRDDGSSWWVPIDFTRQRLREYSIVPVPANPDCLKNGVQAASNLGIDTIEFRRMIESSIDAAGLCYVPRSQLLALRRSLPGSKLVIDMRKLGTFELAEKRADGDLKCPECGYEGPASAFEMPKDSDEEESTNVDAGSELGHPESEVRGDPALLEMAQEALSLVNRGRLD